MAKDDKSDMRDGMWERGAVVTDGPVSEEPQIVRDPQRIDIVRPDFKPQAEGQTTHQ
jgi:hypothetical protein